MAVLLCPMVRRPLTGFISRVTLAHKPKRSRACAFGKCAGKRLGPQRLNLQRVQVRGCAGRAEALGLIIRPEGAP